MPRAAGVLLHPTSLPAPYGIGDLGPAALDWLDWLSSAGVRVWQVLPLGPTGYGDSPYQCFSAVAGNPLLVSPEVLQREGLLDQASLAAAPAAGLGAHGRVQFDQVIPLRQALLRAASTNFAARGGDPEFAAFCEREAGWLAEFALFMALKQCYGGVAWSEWPRALRLRAPEALARARAELAGDIVHEQFVQWQFFRQWGALRARARERGIRIIGDLPIFVAYDSADVWAHPELFQLDAEGQPTVVAGVPPDYFSESGQRWGNPLYRWDTLAARGYDWWVERLRASLALVDLVRIDHFRGFAGYWAIPADEPTAVRGEWRPGPGAALFEALYAALGGDLPIIAEDLGVITPDVDALRDRFGLPGMRILQFAFTADTDPDFLPHNYVRNTVAYTGTHDNNTTVGWFAEANPAQQARIRRYTGTDGTTIAWDFIRLVLGSVADTAIVPLQDVLCLDATARMNTPGTPSGNWTWRVAPGALTPELAARLADLIEVYER